MTNFGIRRHARFMHGKHTEIAEQFQKIINKFIFLEKRSIFEVKGVKLYPSEIHVLLLIPGGQATNATKMAELLGVTKGAVSQTISRLEKKGILHKVKDPYKKNELTLSLTPLGQQAMGQFQTLQASFHSQYNRHLAGFDESERAVIQRFLAHVEGIVDTFLP